MTTLALKLLLAALAALPPLVLRTPEGAPLDLAALRARVLVVDIWATWCVPCKRALPHLERLAAERATQGLVVLAVSEDEDPEKVAPFARSLGLKSVRVALDTAHALAERLTPEAMPTTFVFDAVGKLRHTFTGYEEGDEVKLRAAVDALLAEPAAR